MMEDEVRKIVTEIVKRELEKIPRVYQDSVEMGSPTKGGGVKVYFNASDVAEAKIRVDNAIAVRDHMAHTILNV